MPKTGPDAECNVLAIAKFVVNALKANIYLRAMPPVACIAATEQHKPSHHHHHYHHHHSSTKKNV